MIMSEKPIEITVRRGDEFFRVFLAGEAMKDVENLSSKLGTDSIIKAIVYSIKILSEGLKQAGKGEHQIELPNGKKAKIKLE